jgi:hypothetical protein
MLCLGLIGSRGTRGDGWVQHQLKRSYAFTALMLAIALSGCADVNTFDSNERWFAKPFDWTGQSGGYSFSELQETQKRQQPVTAADLVDANGACPPAPSAPAPVAAPTAAAEGPGVMPVVPSSDSLFGQGVGLGMTECEVVWRAGAPSSVQIGAGPNGTRTAVLTFNSGPRAGIYRFEGGRLMDMDGVQTAENAPPVTKPKRVARKKPEPAQSEQITTE